MCAKWAEPKKGYNPSFLFEGLERIKKINPEGQAGFQGVEFDDYFTVLLSSVEFTGRIPEVERQGILRAALFSVAQQGKLTQDAVLKQVSANEVAYLRQPIKPFVLLSSLSVHYHDEIKSSSLGDVKITLTPNLPKGFSQQAVVERAQRMVHGDLPDDYSYVRVEVSARSIFEAAEQALDSLDLLRGIWNYLSNRRHHLRWSTSRREPINTVMLGPIHTLHKPGGEIASDTYWYEPDYAGPAPSFRFMDQIDAFRKEERLIRNRLTRHRYRVAVEDLIKAYTRALDTRDYKSAFISLWSVLERLTNTEQARYDVTIRRASFLLDDEAFHRQILNHLRDHRNRAVHIGETINEIETILYQLKRYVEVALGFHISNFQDFSTIAEAASFMDLPCSVDELKRKTILYKKAIRFRE